MRNGWSESTLGEVAELISRGRAPSYCDEDGVTVLNQKCVRNGRIHFEFARRTDISKKVIPEWAYLKTGDTLINSTGVGTLGRASFVTHLNGPTTFDSHVTLVRPRPNSCLPSFIGLNLNFRESEIEMFAGGSTGQTELSREAVNAFPISLPPLEVQKRIVDVVSSVDAFIDALQQQADTARTARNAVAEEAINCGFPTSQLSQIGKIVTGSTPTTKRSEYWEPAEVDFVTPGDFGEQLLIRNASRRISREGANVSRVLASNSVVQVCIGATIGKVGYVSHEVVTNQQINSLVGLEELDAYFVSLMLSTNELQVNISDRAGTTTLPIISKSAWGELSIPWPDVQIRQGIALLAKSIDEFVLATGDAITNAKNLRSGLLSDLLSGEHEIPSSYDAFVGAA